MRHSKKNSSGSRGLAQISSRKYKHLFEEEDKPKKETKIKQNRKSGILEEERAAKDLDMERVKGSGCGPVNKGDLLKDGFCIQHKCTTSHVIHINWIVGAEQDACFKKRKPALILLNPDTRKRVFMVRELDCDKTKFKETITINKSKKINDFEDIADGKSIVCLKTYRKKWVMFDLKEWNKL